jgi:hypothetical protein
VEGEVAVDAVVWRRRMGVVAADLGFEVRQGSSMAAMSWCTPSAAPRRLRAVQLLTLMVEWRPFGGLASMSALHDKICRRQLLSSSRLRCQRGGSSCFNMALHGGVTPSGEVPGGCAASHALKILVGDSLRRWRTRSRFTNYVQGPFYKAQGRDCNFCFFLGPCVIFVVTAFN